MIINITPSLQRALAARADKEGKELDDVIFEALIREFKPKGEMN